MPQGQFPQILAGQTYTAALLQSMVPPTAYKTINTSRASATTLTADPDLQAAVVANATYDLGILLGYEGGTQGSSDIQFGWTFPSGTTIRWMRDGTTLSGTRVSGIGWNTETQTASLGTSGAGTGLTGLIQATIVTAATAGTVAFRWAQNTSSATPTIVYAGSRMRLTRMA